MIKRFGSTKEVFVNQDEGMFVAFPITLDENVLTLETASIDGRKYVKAGSVVLEGTTVRGILAEEYDITYGPVVGRVVLEGYCWVDRLTANAVAAVASLPKIIVLPYKLVVFEAGAQDKTAHKAVVKVRDGLKFASDIAVADLTITTLTASAVAVDDSGTELTITFSGAGKGSLTAIDLSKIVGAVTGSAVRGLPIALDV